MRISDWSSDVCSSDLMKCYEGNRVHRSDSNGWNGWHLADDVEILSIEQGRHGKPLRHKFEIPVDLLASPDQSWFRYEPDQILEAFRWLAISGRSEERRVGNGWVSTCGSRWAQYH